MKITLLQSFHMAGDGKLGGVVDPNDGQCHLNISGFYEWSKLQGELTLLYLNLLTLQNCNYSNISDYPSLGHIAHVAREHSVNIIWAVTSAHINLYNRWELNS